MLAQYTAPQPEGQISQYMGSVLAYSWPWRSMALPGFQQIFVAECTMHNPQIGPPQITNETRHGMVRPARQGGPGGPWPTQLLG